MSIRIITDHKLNGLNDAINIAAIGTPNPIGVNVSYALCLHSGKPDAIAKKELVIDFQDGPIKSPDDFNGWTNEALIAIVIDRLRGFQGENPRPSDYGANTPDRGPNDTPTAREIEWGKFLCRENAEAKTLLETALMWLQKRTRDRMARGVEGTHQA
jgi:hypothetical protein